MRGLALNLKSGGSHATSRCFVMGHYGKYVVR